MLNKMHYLIRGSILLLITSVFYLVFLKITFSCENLPHPLTQLIFYAAISLGIIMSIIAKREKNKHYSSLFLLTIILVITFLFVIAFTPICYDDYVSIENARKFCNESLHDTCNISKKLPDFWNHPIFRVKETKQFTRCLDLLKCSSCEECINPT